MVGSSFPTTAAAIIGFLITVLGAGLTYAGKLISSLRDDIKAKDVDIKAKDAELKALNEKIQDRIVPAVEASTRVGEAVLRVAERMTAPREPRSR